MVLAGSRTAVEPQSRSCIAFRQSHESSILRIAGWLCAPKDRVVERPAVAILMDRMTLIGAGADRPLHQIFVDAEMAKRATHSGPARKAFWFDPSGEPPPLRMESRERKAKIQTQTQARS